MAEGKLGKLTGLQGLLVKLSKLDWELIAFEIQQITNFLGFFF